MRLRLRAAERAQRRTVAPSRRPLAPPRSVIRSGTALEVAEIAWIAEAVSRESALSIPSVAACRNLIVGTVVQLGLFKYRGGERLDADYLVERPDPATTIAATMGGTVDDLLFYGRAYWRVLDRDADGYPRRARWTPKNDVAPKTEAGPGSYQTLVGYDVAGVERTLDPDALIRFDSPLPGVLDVGGRTLAAALELEDAARRLSAVELPAGTLTNLGTELSDEEAQAKLDAFRAARRESGVAWLENVEYSAESISPADLQLIEARANVATDVARLFNVPVSMIGASPSGNASALLYSNLSQQLAILVSSAVAPHLRTVELTLSDVYPRGTSVAFDVQTFLRSDPQAAADYAIALVTAEPPLASVAEGRAFLGIPSSPPAGDLTPGEVS